MRLIQVIALAVLLAVWMPPVYSATLHVSPAGNDANPGTESRPFATPQRARDAIRQLKQAGPLDAPVTVVLHGGTYQLTGPMVLEPQDSGTEAAPITYAAAPGEHPTLSGGRRITGWKKASDTLWMTELPEVKAGQWRFRQLFVNGQSRPRARTPNEGFLRVAGFPDGGHEVPYHTDCRRFEFKPGDLDPSWTNLQDVEVIVYHFWTDSHLPIQSIDAATHIVTFANKAGKVFTDDFTANGARYIVENVFEALDQPGEWYLNRHTGVLYYMPKPGEDMSTAEVIAPQVPAFLSIRGNPTQRQFVEFITFQDLTFEYTYFELPPGNSNDQQGSAGVTAAVTLTGARQCSFEKCEFVNLGTWAIEVGKGCTDNVFSGNEIHYVAAGGFRVNGGTERDHPLDRTANNVIADNHLHHYGEVYPSAVGILLMNAEGSTVEHNHIHHGWYTGISVGWVWGYGRSISRDNRIEFNHIHDLGQGLLSDMGGIYTLGVSPGTVIRNNLIHDVESNQYGGWGIYHDEGSTHLLVENNVVYNTKFAAFNIHYAKEVTVRNNVFALGRLEQLSRGRVEPHKSVFFEGNIVYWKAGGLLAGNWKDEPYTFHFNPSAADSQVTSTFEFDWNLYFNPALKLEQVTFAGGTWADWQKRGKDVHSLYADPLFVDAYHFDFQLKPESPALAMGFRPIDVNTVGPQIPTGPAAK